MSLKKIIPISLLTSLTLLSPLVQASSKIYSLDEYAQARNLMKLEIDNLNYAPIDLSDLSLKEVCHLISDFYQPVFRRIGSKYFPLEKFIGAQTYFLVYRDQQERHLLGKWLELSDGKYPEYLKSTITSLYAHLSANFFKQMKEKVDSPYVNGAQVVYYNYDFLADLGVQIIVNKKEMYDYPNTYNPKYESLYFEAGSDFYITSLRTPKDYGSITRLQLASAFRLDPEYYPKSKCYLNFTYR